VKETLKVIKISDNIFFEVIIKEDEDNLSIDCLKVKAIESRFEELINQVEKALFLHTDTKKTHLLIFEMISNRDQKFNENIIDAMFLLQIDLKINEILNSDQNQEMSILDSSIENDSHLQSSTKSKKNKQSMIISNDVVIMNIKSRKQTYSTALIIV
jgi:hypothetical protein